MINKSPKKEQIIEKYKKIFKDAERLPIPRDFTDDELDIINHNLGGLSNLKKLYIPSSVRLHGNKWLTEEMIIREIRDLADYLGYPPHNSDYSRAATALNKFGAPWSNVLRKCGIKATFKNNAHISKEEIIVKTKKAIKKYGRFPNWQELSKEHVPVSFIHVYWKDFDHFSREFGDNLSRKQRYQTEVKLYDTAIKELIKEGAKINLTTLLQRTKTSKREFRNYLGKEVARGNLKSRSIARFFAKYGIDYTYKNSIKINGVKYKSLHDASQKLGITEGTLKKRIEWFGHNSKWLTHKGSFSKKFFVKIGDTVYPTLSIAAEELGINRMTLRARLIKYGNRPDILLSKSHIYPKDHGKPIIICGKKYKHISEASKQLNIAPCTLMDRIRRFGTEDPRVVVDASIPIYKLENK